MKRGLRLPWPAFLAVVLVVLPAGLAKAGVYEDGLAAKKAGRHEEAAALLGRATAAQPANVEAWFHYGTVLGWLERHDEALAALRRGLKLAPRDFDLRLGEARVLAWKADYPAARARLDELAAEHPGNLDVMVMRGRVAGWQEDRAAAREIYQAILEKDPVQVDALTGLGDLEAEQGRKEEARALFEQALQQDPSPDIQKRLDGLRNNAGARVDFGLTGSTFARRPRDEWWSFYAAYTQKLWGWDVWVRGEYGERFGFQDDTWEVGAAGQLLPVLHANVFAGYTPDADFSAHGYVDASLRWRVFENLGPRLGAGWLLTEARWADYAASGLWTTRLGWEQDLGKGWTLNARWLRFAYDTGASTNGWLAWLSWEPKDRWLLRVGAGQAVESITNQTLRANNANISSWTVFAGVVVPVSEHWHVRVDVEREEVEGSVIRHGLGLGVGRRF